MKSRLFFRENGYVINTRSRGVLGNVAFALSAIAMMLGLLAWGHSVDDQAAAYDTYEAGLAVGRVQLLETVAEAYLQGHRDAAAAGAACPPMGAPPAVAPAPSPMLLTWSGQ